MGAIIIRRSPGGGLICLQPRASLRRTASNQRMRTFAFIALVAIALAGCTAHDRSPDAIREQTARATSTAVRDAKAVTQGIVQGVRQQRTININKASVQDLTSLDGIDDGTARRIVGHRPYADSYELVRKHIITKTEYNKIAGKIEAR
jgi:DNA uptake protein ComE-like DNA-binding protein